MKKIIIAGIILGIVLGISISFLMPEKKIDNNNVVEDENILEKLGYNTSEIAFISSLDDDEENYFESHKYIPFLTSIIESKYFIKDKYKLYIDNYDKYKDNTIEVVNTNTHLEYYTNISEVDMSKDELMLVNKFHQLDEEYEPSDLEKVTIGYGYLRKNANDALNKMNEDAKKNEINLYVTSSHRPFDMQKRVYDNYVLSDGVEEADEYSARPGHSEHQTGLAVDFIKQGGSFRTFYQSDDFTWLIDNAYKYGFILRYPENKEDITGFIYESWHYRYVGLEVAEYIHENKITFDEYYAFYLGSNDEN